MAKQALLDRALSMRSSRTYPPQLTFTKDEVPLCLAFLRGEISTREYAFALDVRNPGSITHRTPVFLKEAISRGWIIIKAK